MIGGLLLLAFSNSLMNSYIAVSYTHLTTMFVVIMLFSNSYKKIERAIIAFVSVIGLSFLYELFLVDIDWPVAIRSWVVPEIPQGSMPVSYTHLDVYKRQI